MRSSFLLIVCCALCACGSRNTPVSTDWVGLVAPPTFVSGLDGTRHTLATGYRQELVLFFASWCARSRAQLNDLAQAALHERSVVYFAVSIDEPKDEKQLFELMGSFAHTPVTFGYSGDGVYDQAYRHFRGTELPLVVALGRDRRVKYVGGRVRDGLQAFRE